jgi:hypothetical protein
MGQIPDYEIPVARTSLWGRQRGVMGPDLTIEQAGTAGAYYFLLGVNGYTASWGRPKVDFSGTANSDIALLVENVPGGTRTTFNAVTYASYTRSADGSLATSSTTLAATGVNVAVRSEYLRMSRRVFRHRVYLSADVATTVKLTVGLAGVTTDVATVTWDDHNPQANDGARVMVGRAYSRAGYTSQQGVGVGIVDGWLARRCLTSADKNVSVNPVTGQGPFGCCAGDNGSGLPCLAVGPTETWVDFFYFGATWKDAAGQHRELALCYADACGVPQGPDDIIRLAAATPVSCKGVTGGPGSSTPQLSYQPGADSTYFRDAFFAQLTFSDHPFSAALLSRFCSNLGTGGDLNCVADHVIGPSSWTYFRAGDSNAIALLWAFYLRARAVETDNTATKNGMTNLQRNAILGYYLALDDGSGSPVFNKAAHGSGLFGHYDWIELPASGYANYVPTQMLGYYACALIAAYALGYDDGQMATRIARTTALYAATYDASLGHLYFVRDADSGAKLTYDSVIDLLPEFFARTILGTSLLGDTITAACVRTLLARQQVTLRHADGSFGGRAIRLMMRNDGATFLPDAEFNYAPKNPGAYVNGGTQLPWDLVVAFLGQQTGVPGMRSFWGDRKLAETFLEFDLHEALCLANPGPDGFNPYGGRTIQRNMAWHGLAAWLEAFSGLVG